MKTGDTNLVRMRVRDAETNAIADLTGATAQVHLRKKYTELVHTYEMTVLADGIVQWKRDAGDLEPGIYDFEVEVTAADGTIVTAPGIGFGTIRVDQDLTPADLPEIG